MATASTTSRAAAISSGYDELSRPDLLRRAAAEGLATFALVFAAAGRSWPTPSTTEHARRGRVSLVFGLIIMVMVYATGHLSGAHINPAVTLAFTLSRHFPGRDASRTRRAGPRRPPARWSCSRLVGPAGDLGATVPSVGLGSAFVYESVLTAF